LIGSYKSKKKYWAITVKKATTEFAGRTYVAWYTTEISIMMAI
jgi:GLPGLI family protein